MATIAAENKKKPFKNQHPGFSASVPHSPHKIFSHGSSIVKTNVHSNHIRHLHTNAPNADVGGRFGNDREVKTEAVDGAPSFEPEILQPGFPIGMSRGSDGLCLKGLEWTTADGDNGRQFDSHGRNVQKWLCSSQRG